MQFPSSYRTAAQKISVPQLNGGVNFADNLENVSDNQLTNLLNMYYKEGLLKARPGYVGHERMIVPKETFSIDSTITKATVKKYDGDDEITYFSMLNSYSTDAQIPYSVEILAIKKGGFAGYCELVNEESNVYVDNVFMYSGKSTLENGKGVYAMLRYRNNKTGEFSHLELWEEIETEEEKFFEIVPKDKYYIPTLYVNGKGNKYYTLEASVTTKATPASLFEGFNALTGGFKAYFLTDGVSDSFTLPVDNIEFPVTVKYTDSKGNVYTWNVTSTHESDFKTTVGEKDISCIVDNISGTINFAVGSDGYALPRVKGISNNLEICAFKRDKVLEERIGGMTFAEWFGGSSEGINGGTRLFCSGNPSYQNMVCWSDVDNPLYFPENCYANVGSADEPITALAKQSDMLCIYKRHELWYTVYSAGNSYTAEDVIAGRVIDVTLKGATFPLIMISGEIGCTCPQTIKLCHNRLVWMTDEGKIYNLVSANQYSKTNIYPIGAMVEPLLKELSLSDRVSAFASIWNGYYLLKAGENIYALDFDSYYFKYNYSYADTDKGNRKLSWYLWDIPLNDVSGDYLSFANGELIWYRGPNADNEDSIGAYIVAFSLEDGEKDKVLKKIEVTNAFIFEQKDVEAFFQTKLFTFGETYLYKRVKNIYVKVGANTKQLNVEFLTQRGVKLSGYVKRLFFDADSRTPEYLKIVRLPANLPRVTSFGLKIGGKGLEIASIGMEYETLGDVK